MTQRFAGRFSLLRPLGRGGMGEVHLARDLTTGVECALKRLPDRLRDVAPRVLRREFEALSRVRHPGTVAVHDMGFAPDGTGWLSMEYVPGLAADRAVARGDWITAAAVAGEVLLTLEALHAAVVMHGDLKPSNVLVVPGAAGAPPVAVRLLDFGLATLGAEEGAGHRGTPGYAAPEVVAGAAPTVSSDLYGLGACLYAMVAGRPPFPGAETREVLLSQRAGPPPALPLEEVRAPGAAVSFILRLLAPNPAERPADAREARLELERIAPSARRPLGERLKAVRVIGREKELARLEAWIAAAPERRPRVMELTGPSGSGKTTLLRELATRASLSGRLVVQMTCGAHDRPEALADDLARRLAAACGEEAGDASAAEWAARCADRGTPALVLLDDVERLDPASFAVLRRIALDEGAPLRWVWARRELKGEALEAERVLHHAGVAERIALGSLDEDDAARLAAARLGRPAPEPLEAFLWSGANGHPGLTVALLEAAAARGAIEEREHGLAVRAEQLSGITAPGDFDEARLARLGELPSGSRAAAAALAACACALDPRALTALAPAADAAAREALVDAGLATRDDEGRLVLHPPALGPRILAGLDADARRELHRAAAALPGIEPARAFRHHAEAGDRVAALAAAERAFEANPDRDLAARAAKLAESADPVIAAGWHDRAAQACFEASRYAAAIPHLERSLELDAAPDRRGDRWARLSTAYLRSGRLGDVARTVERARSEGVTGGPLSRLLGNEASRLFNEGDSEAARTTANDALQLATAARDGYGVGVAATNLVWLDLGSGRVDVAEANARCAIEGFQSAGNAAGAIRAAGLVASVARARGRLDEAVSIQREALDAARRYGHRLVIGDHLVTLNGLLVEAGKWDEAEALCAEAVRLALEDGRSPEAAVALSRLGVAEAQVGKTALARRHATTALRLARNADPRSAAQSWRALAQAERAAGRLRRAENAARLALEAAIGASDYDVDWSRIEFGLVCAAAGRWEEAAAAWKRVVEQPISEDRVALGVAQALEARASLRRAEGIDEAVRLASRIVSDRPLVAAIANLLGAEIALAQRRSGDAIEAARDALAAFEGLPAPAERAAAALELARLAPPTPVLRESVLEWLDLAARTFERLGDHGRRRSALTQSVEWLRRTAAVTGPRGEDSGLVERVSWLLNSLTDLGELTQRAMRAAVEQLGAERGMLLLADAETGQLAPMADHGVVDQETKRSMMGFSRHVVSLVTESGDSVLIGDAPVDPRAASESVLDMRLLSILCVPMFLGGRVIGAVYLDDSRQPHKFGQTERRMLEGFAHLMAVAIEKAQGHEEVRRVNELLEGENLSLRQAMGAQLRTSGVIGSSTPMQKILGMAEHAARVSTTVLITGESGTGKELIARTIHHGGKRRLKPFVTVNCGALTESLLESQLFGILANVATDVKAHSGKFVQADGGTLFLDEIGEMPVGQQVALLAAIANREVTPVGGGRPIPIDVRVIAATNQNLRRLIEQGKFREDLYYRLSVIELEVPPLRERKADIPALAQSFLQHFAKQQEREVPQLSPDFLAVLMQSDWPGNVRELQNYIERVLAMTPGRLLRPEPPPRDLQRRSAFPRLARRRLSDAVGEIERKMVGEALERARGNQSFAARELGLTEQAMRYRLRKYGIASARRNRRIRRK